MIILLALCLSAALAVAAVRRVRGEPRRARVGRYELGPPLGVGGMGAVYRARNITSDSLCAVKLLPGGASAFEQRCFEQEARFGAKLCHRNIAAVHERGTSADGTCYIAMELVAGETLQRLVERDGPLPRVRAVHIALELCAALRHMHERGLAHRDVKPENVIVGRDGVKLIDLGLIERIGAGSEPRAVVGTPLYLAPEAIAQPEVVDARSDVYALGAVLYFMLCGSPVFGGSSALELCMRHLYATPEPPSARRGSRLPAALERIIMDCLAKNATGRPPSAAALEARLGGCLGSLAPCPVAAAARRPSPREGLARARRAPRHAVAGRAAASRSRSARPALLAYDARAEPPS